MKEKKIQAVMGLHLTYSMAWVMVCYGVFALLPVVLHAINLFGSNGIEDSEYIYSFTRYLAHLPLEVCFLATLLVPQIIVGVGYLRQEREGMAVKRIPLSAQAIMKSRMVYSFLVGMASVMIHFVTIWVMYLLYMVRFPENVYGSAGMYTAFYDVEYLAWFYPIGEPLRFVWIAIALLGLAMITIRMSMIWEHGVWSQLFISLVLLVASWLASAEGEVVINVSASLVILAFFVVLYVRHMRGNRKENEQA